MRMDYHSEEVPRTDLSAFSLLLGQLDSADLKGNQFFILNFVPLLITPSASAAILLESACLA